MKVGEGMSNQKMKKKMVGIELGSSGLKMVVGEFQKENLSIKKVISNPLPDNVYVDGEINDIEMVADLLKKTIRKNKIRVKDCLCCMSSSQIITREVNVPSQNKEHIEDVAKYEVEQYLPVEMDNYTVQAIVMKEYEIDDKPMAEMLVTAFPKKLIDQMYRIVLRAGLKPTILDTQSNAFSKMIENQSKINGNYYHREGNCAFIDLGSESIKIQIFRKGRFGFSQNIPYGGRDLDTNISKFMDIPLEDAIRKKMQVRNMNYTVDETSEEAKLINIMKSTMSSWFEEINKIFRYYRTRNIGSQGIEYIYIYGGLSNIPGLCDYVESQFKVPVERVKKVSSVELPADSDISDIMNTIGVFYRRQV